VVELTEEIVRHRQSGRGADALNRRRLELARTRFMSLLSDRLVAELLRRLGPEAVDVAVAEIASRKVDPYSATARVVQVAGMGEQ
jgi:hypothetical protein